MAISQLGAHDLALAHVESRNRDEIRLSSQASIVNDKTAHPGLSAYRADPVVIGGSLYFTAAGSVGGYGQSDAAGAAVNDALIVAAIGPQATLNATGRRRCRAGAGGPGRRCARRHADAGAQRGPDRGAQRLAGGAFQRGWRGRGHSCGGRLGAQRRGRGEPAGRQQPVCRRSVQWSARRPDLTGQRMNLRVDRDDRGAYGKASAITIDRRLLAPEIVIHGSETGANTVRFGATADAGGALDGNGLLTQGNTMRILGGSGQDDIEIRARLIAQQLLTVSTQDGDDRVVLQSTETSGGVRIETGAGNDTVSVIGTRVGGGLSILTGDGGNVVTLDTATVGGDTSITSGKDADQITLVNSGLTGGLTIDAGDGGNVVRLDTTTVGGATRITTGKDVDQITLVNSGLTGGLTIDAGDGGNVVKLETVTVGGDTRITTGKDADQITLVNSGLTIDAGDGGNVVALETVTVGGDTSIVTGRDADQITLTRTVGQGMLRIDAGDGDNRVLLSETVQHGATTILTGNGQDLISLSMADFLGRLHVESGAGNDKIWMSQILLGAGATVLGGDGDDYIYLSARALAGGVSISAGAGNDLIVLDKLPSLTSRQTVPGQVDRVDVDGGAGSNRVIVNLAEALTSVLINVHHSDGQGRENLAGVNQLTINGTAQDETFLLRAGYLAKLTPQGAGYADAVQRVNYDRTSTGGLRLNAVDGGNRFYIDDTGTQVVIDGGRGSDPAKRNEFQIGQLYGLDRLLPSVAAGDRIDTVRTTQGYLSRGNSHGMTIYGAENSVNVFRIYSNAAPLALHGGKRDDAFMVYAFKQDQALAGGARGYVLNGELSIDGGEGVNTYTTLGTEEDDAFVLTQEGLRGAGLNTRYQNIQRVNLDAREGNDHIYVLSTRSNVITTLIGGSGSNTFDLSGDVAGNTIVSGRDGSRGVLDGKQPVVVTAQPGALNGSGGAPLALSVSLDMGILPRPASGQAYVSLTSAMLASALYGSLTQGTGLSAADGLAAVRQGLQGRGLLLSTDGGQTWHESVVLAFDANGVGGQGWDTTRQVLVKLEDGPGIGLPPVSLAYATCGCRPRCSPRCPACTMWPCHPSSCRWPIRVTPDRPTIRARCARRAPPTSQRSSWIRSRA
ncbi:hypothetical protein WJ970_36080 [Achromobacter xylosoxidans]